MIKYIKLTGITFALSLSAALATTYLYQMHKRGGFETIPDDARIVPPRVVRESNFLGAQGKSFSFAVLGDMRWSSPPRIAVLKDAQHGKPLFMVNLGDPVEFGSKPEWEKYIGELLLHWDGRIPYYHTPGGHSINFRINGIYPAFFGHYFGETDYYVDVNDWRFIFLDTSMTYLSRPKAQWLYGIMERCKKDGRTAVIFTHCPPYSADGGVTHALMKGSTDRLAEVLAGRNVAAIFAGHIHTTFSYKWNGIPVYVTSLNAATWTDDHPAEYLHVTVADERLDVRPVYLPKRHTGPQD